MFVVTAFVAERGAPRLRARHRRALLLQADPQARLPARPLPRLAGSSRSLVFLGVAPRHRRSAASCPGSSRSGSARSRLAPYLFALVRAGAAQPALHRRDLLRPRRADPQPARHLHRRRRRSSSAYASPARCSQRPREPTRWPRLLDPFGLAAFELATRYWTVVERNTQRPAARRARCLLNRLLWSASGAGGSSPALALLALRRSTAAGARKRRREAVEARTRRSRRRRGARRCRRRAAAAGVRPRRPPGGSSSHQARLEIVGVLQGHAVPGHARLRRAQRHRRHASAIDRAVRHAASTR